MLHLVEKKFSVLVFEQILVLACPQMVADFGKGLRDVAVAEHAGYVLLRNFNGRVHQTFLHVQVLHASPCNALAPNIFVLGLQCALLSACTLGTRVLICILPGVLKRTRIKIALVHVHMTVHLSFSILE